MLYKYIVTWLDSTPSWKPAEGGGPCNVCALKTRLAALRESQSAETSTSWPSQEGARGAYKAAEKTFWLLWIQRELISPGRVACVKGSEVERPKPHRAPGTIADDDVSKKFHHGMYLTIRATTMDSVNLGTVTLNTRLSFTFSLNYIDVRDVSCYVTIQDLWRAGR